MSKAGLSAPNSVAFDSSGNLWVVDGSRVLEYAHPFSTHQAASMVIGQNTFTNSSATTSSSTVANPNGIAFDPSGDLWIGDKGNNRVLEFTTPISTGEAASLVLGQPNFTSSATTPETEPSATGLYSPSALAFDSSGDLWVADFGDGRVLQYGGAVSTPVPGASGPDDLRRSIGGRPAAGRAASKIEEPGDPIAHPLRQAQIEGRAAGGGPHPRCGLIPTRFSWMKRRSWRLPTHVRRSIFPEQVHRPPCCLPPSGFVPRRTVGRVPMRYGNGIWVQDCEKSFLQT